jgi:Family of unknown function (DUF5372)
MRGKNTGLYKKKTGVHTAQLSTRVTRKFRVTHPFHPLFCQEFENTSRKRLSGRNHFVFYDNMGKKTTIPVKWTDAPEEEDAYVVISAGRSYFRVEDLIGLSDLIRSLENDILVEF